jgi:membrane-associated protease RseP (regulator of RpoE activity)
MAFADAFKNISPVLLVVLVLAIGVPLAIFGLLGNNYLLAGLVVFVAGFVLLYRTKFKRYIVFFMLETRHGLNFVDRVARLSPAFWKFFGDVAIVVSFGGFGAYYVSRYRNTWLINVLVGIAALVLTFTSVGPEPALAGVFVLVAGAVLLRKTGKPVFHFLAGAAVMATIMFSIYPGFSDVAAFRPFVAALVGVFGVPALLVSTLFSQAFKIAMAQSNVPGVSPLLPTISEEGPGFFFPGTGIFIPFWQALIAIICLLVPHELAHGILTRAHKIRLKSVGILTASVIPIGAFVEPDERIMRLRRSREKMRIYAVGSFTNLIVAILSILLIFFVLAPAIDAITEPTGMVIANVMNNTPASGILQKGFVITEINGLKTNSSDTFNKVVAGLKPNQTATFVTTNGTFNITLTSRPDNASRGYIGIDLQQTYNIKEAFRTKYRLQTEAAFFLAPTLFWIFFLSFNIALVNLLPVSPFDGGKMFEEIMADFRVRRKNKELLLKIVLSIIIVLLLMNASPLLLNLFR